MKLEMLAELLKYLGGAQAKDLKTKYAPGQETPAVLEGDAADADADVQGVPGGEEAALVAGSDPAEVEGPDASPEMLLKGMDPEVLRKLLGEDSDAAETTPVMPSKFGRGR